MDEMDRAHRRDTARAGRMRAIVNAIDEADEAGDLERVGQTRAEILNNARKAAQDERDHIVAVWD